MCKYTLRVSVRCTVTKCFKLDNWKKKSITFDLIWLIYILIDLKDKLRINFKNIFTVEFSANLRNASIPYGEFPYGIYHCLINSWILSFFAFVIIIFNRHARSFVFHNLWIQVEQNVSYRIFTRIIGRYLNVLII